MLVSGRMSSHRLLLVSGSLRAGSTNTALLRTAQFAAPPGITAVLYDDLARLPYFSPDDDRPPLHPAVAGLRAAIRASDAVLFCTPEYAGALPGSFKNMLEWTIGDDQPGSIYEKRVAWVNVSLRAHRRSRRAPLTAHRAQLRPRHDRRGCVRRHPGHEGRCPRWGRRGPGHPRRDRSRAARASAALTRESEVGL